MRALAGQARLLAATAIYLTSSVSAMAQDYGLISTTSDPILNPSGTTLQGARTGVFSTGPSLSLDNAGTIRGDGSNNATNVADGGVIFSGGPGTIANSGLISGARVGIATTPFDNGGTFEGRAIGSTVANSGSIIGDNGAGIRLVGGGSVTNSGYIAGRVGPGADGIVMFAYSGQDTSGLTGIGSVTNLAGGLIEGNRFGVFLIGGGSVDNAGTINHTVSVQGSGLFTPGKFGNVTNSGTILNGGISLSLLEGGTANNSGLTGTIGFAGVGTANVTNSGTVTYFTSFSTVNTANVNNSGSIGEGLVFNKTTTANVTNSGSITATNTPDVVGTTRDAVYSSAALTLANTATGSINGFVNGIRSDGTSASIDNAGIIRGNGTSTIFSSPNGGILATGGPLTLSNSGTITGDQFGVTTFDFLVDANSGQFQGRAIGSTVNNSGTIIGDHNDGVRLIGGGTVTNSGYIAGRVGSGADGVSAFNYADQDSSLFSSIGTVNNLSTGVIEGNRYGVILSGGGTINNAGTISGTAGGFVIQATDGGKIGTVVNSGTINGTAQFNGLYSASLNNSGTISSSIGNGVFTTAPSGSLAVTNQATGSITGAASGVRSEGSSLSVTNAGTIRGNGTASTLRAADAGILVIGGPASITNSGNVSGAGFGITTGVYSDPVTNAASGRAIGTTVTNTGSIIGDTNDGVRLIGGGTVTNSGYIAGRVTSGADGVSMFAHSDQDTTALPQIGTVNNLLGGTIEGFRFGIIQSGGGTINNAGIINGGTNGAILIQTGFIDGKTGNINNSGTINGSTTFFDLTSANVVNSGTMSALSGQAIWTSAPSGSLSVNNQAGGSITGASSAIQSDGSTLSLTNAGTIRGNGTVSSLTVPNAGVVFSGGPATITNSGSISGAKFGIASALYTDPDTNQVNGRAIGSVIQNSGSIIGDDGHGIRLIGGGIVTNSGYVAGRSGGGATADGISMFASNDQDTSGSTGIGTVNNLAGATIEGQRLGVLLSGGGTINNAGTISGNAGGIAIQADRPGKVGMLSNAGTINGGIQFIALASASMTNSGSISTATGDAVGSNSALTLTNSLTGSIVGADNGIYSESSSLVVNNAGTIRGNGINPSSGGGILGTTGPATITNSGTISGFYNGIRLLAGGTVTNSGSVVGEHLPAVQFDAGGTLTNSGQIRGVLIYGGGTINNSGTVVGNTVMDSISSTDPIVGGTITNSGTLGNVFFEGNVAGTLSNIGTTGHVTFMFNHAGAATFVNSGTINGGSGTAVELSDANDTATLMTGSSISGAVDGRNGSDTLRLSGTLATPTALQTVGRFLNFENLNVLGGFWTAPGSTGSFTSTTINGGALAINGTITSPISVNAGAMLAGTGTITGALTANSGGTVAPGGSSIGTLSVTGNVFLNAGSIFSVQTNPNGTSDKLAVTGAVTIAKGATIQILAGIFPNYSPAGTSYVVLTAGGGINGKFDSPPITDYAYFKATVNVQQKGTVTVQITPNGKPLPSAATVSTFGTASAVDSLGGNSGLYQAVLYQSLSGARQAFQSLSGSGYARLDAMMDQDVGSVRLALTDRNGDDAPTIAWSGVNSLAARGAKSSLLRSNGHLSLFMTGGRYETRLSSDSISGDVDTRFLASAAAYHSGRLGVLAGAMSAWHDVSISRTVAFPGFSEHNQARYRATTSRIELEGDYDLARGPINIAPYAGYTHLMISSGAFSELGGLSALSFGRERRAVDQLRVGLRAAAKLKIASLHIVPHLDAQIDRLWGAAGPSRTARFQVGQQSFDSGALGFNRRESSLEAGIDASLGRASLAVSYRARLGDQWSDRAARITGSLHF